MVDQLIIAPSDSLKGLLQRGRGRGYLEALTAPKEEVHELLYSCIIDDPRMDRQCESRSTYYAGIPREVRLPLNLLKVRLNAMRSAKSGETNTDLLVSTLIELAKREYEEAVDILIEYLSWGELWHWIIAEPPFSSSTFAQTAVEALEVRFDSDTKLEEAVASLWISDYSQIEKRSSRFREAMLKAQRRRVQKPEIPVPDISQMYLSSVIDLVNGDNVRRLAKLVGQVVREDDWEYLLGLLTPDNPYVSGVALAGLKHLAPPNILDRVLDFWNTLPQKRSKPWHTFLRQAVTNLVLALEPSKTLPIARNWIESDNWNDQRLAEKVLIQHATVEDIPYIRTRLSKILTDEESEWDCFIIKALSHFPNLGHIEELERIYSHVRFARARIYAVEAWVVTSPETFESGYGMECLWDCEANTRALAVRYSPWTDEAASRIRNLADDPFEEEAVRLAAKARLESAL